MDREKTGRAEVSMKNLTYKLVSGPYTVGEIEELVLHDPVRGKELETRVYYPKAGGTFPVIIFSHGGGGSKDGYGDLARFWTSHGYVCIHPTHEDTRLSLQRATLSEEKFRNEFFGFWNNPAKLIDRAKDIPLVIDSLELIGKQIPQLKSKIDYRAVGVGGHSAGAYSAQVIGGAVLTFEDGKPQNAVDDRVRAVVLLSAQGPPQQGLTWHSWDNFTKPMLNVTGSRDGRGHGQKMVTKLAPYLYSPPGERYLLFLEGAGHNLGGIALAIPQPNNPEQLFVDCIKIASLAFWDTFLNTDPAAREYLLSDKIELYSSMKAVWIKKHAQFINKLPFSEWRSGE